MAPFWGPQTTISDMLKRYLKKLQTLQLTALTKGVNLDLCVRSADALLPWVSVTVTKEGWTYQEKDADGNTPGYFSDYVGLSAYLSHEENEQHMSATLAKIIEKVEEFSHLTLKKEESHV